MESAEAGTCSEVQQVMVAGHGCGCGAGSESYYVVITLWVVRERWERESWVIDRRLLPYQH